MNTSKELRILYVHGYNSHKDSVSSQILREAIEKNNIKAIVDAPDIPYLEPSKAIDLVNKASDYDMIVASSLGAFYSLNNVGTLKVLVNVAMPIDVLRLNPELDRNYYDELCSIQDAFFTKERCKSAMKETHFIFGTKDDIARNKDLIVDTLSYNNNIHIIEMEHRLDKVGAQAICDLIKELF